MLVTEAPFAAHFVEAARALSSGEPLRALSLVGREGSPLGLTLRGIAYAQLGDLDLAREALGRALAGTDDPLARARARAALVEIELDGGEPASVARAAAECAAELDRLGDTRNAAMQRLVVARAEVLRGRLGEARLAVDAVLGATVPPDVHAVAWLAESEICIRSLSAREARDALARARGCLGKAPNRALARALEALEEELSRPVARLLRHGVLHAADLFAIEEAARGELLLVDACRLLARAGNATIPLARRPILFALLLELARAFPASVPRDALAAAAFDVRRVNASHRMRLRVEIGRLRKLLDGLGAEPVASPDGYVLSCTRDVVVLLPPTDDEAARIALLLSDGAAWTVRGVAEHASVSKSTAQRALVALVERGLAVRSGSGKTLRYTRPGSPIASRMLLLGLLPKT